MDAGAKGGCLVYPLLVTTDCPMLQQAVGDVVLRAPALQRFFVTESLKNHSVYPPRKIGIGEESHPVPSVF